jgi:phytoene synthase
MFKNFETTSADCSRIITQTYSTSFSLGIKTLHKRFHDPIYGIYGMVRYADEIVDTFHDFDKTYLLNKFKEDTFEAIRTGISLNPVLYSYQKVVNEYNIPLELTTAFFRSMEMDLSKKAYGEDMYEEYIYGSAEVVGLMCLKVFAEGNDELFEQLKQPAKALGAAFQKVNFLRDMKSDFDERGRVYFPGIDFTNFKEESKKKIEEEIMHDFNEALIGINLLPVGAKGGVLLAYKYYLQLFKQIRNVPVSKIKEARIRVPDSRKMRILVSTLFQTNFKNLVLGVE